MTVEMASWQVYVYFGSCHSVVRYFVKVLCDVYDGLMQDELRNKLSKEDIERLGECLS